jgi:hypothetical protein
LETLACKEITEELKTQWKSLWRNRIDDKFRAEGIADNDYSMLFVEKGTVIFATRNFKVLNLREIAEKHKLVDADRVVQPSPDVGGWGKFIRTVVVGQRPVRRVRRAAPEVDEVKRRQQLKKGGRGWLHAGS